jgi:hypothetical protein
VAVARRPDALFQPQFWAEDGPVFFQQAWNEGALHAVTLTYQGFLEEAPRVAALPAVAIGLRLAPALFNLVALAFQVAPAAVFVSSRCDSLVRQRWARLLIAAVYLLLPSAELNMTLSNVQWHLAILAFLLVVARPSRNVLGQVIDGAIVLLAAVTGPFGFLLLPVAGVWYLKHRLTATRKLLVVVSVGVLVQLTAWALGPGRPHTSLGATVLGFLEIIANRVLLAGSFAQDTQQTFTISAAHSPWSVVLAAALVALGLGVTGYALWRGPLALKLFIAFATAIFIGGLLSPAIKSSNVWTELAHYQLGVTSNGGRYFFPAELAWLLSQIWLFARWRARSAAPLLIGLVCLGVGFGDVSNWSYPGFRDLHPRIFSDALQRARKGRVITIPVNPVEPVYATTLAQLARGSRVTARKPPPGSFAMTLVAH